MDGWIDRLIETEEQKSERKMALWKENDQRVRKGARKQIIGK